jgi:hypothetical protein
MSYMSMKILISAFRERTEDTIHTYPDSLHGRIRRSESTKDHHEDIDRLLRACLGYGLVVQHSGVNEAQRHTNGDKIIINILFSKVYLKREKMKNAPGKAAHKRHKLIQIRRSDPTKQSDNADSEEPETVLEPLDAWIAFTTANKQAILHDTDGREELEGYGKKDGHRIEELDLHE